MLIIFISLLLTIGLGLTLLVLLNYAVVSWEQKQVENLAKQIRPEPTTDSILKKAASSHKFTNVDLKNSLQLSREVSTIKQTASRLYTKTITLIQSQDYVSWWQKFTAEIAKLKKDWWATLKSWWHFLLSLAQPLTTEVTTDSSKNQSLKEEKQKQEMAEVVTKIKQTNNIESTDLLKNDHTGDVSEFFEISTSSLQIPKSTTDQEAKATKPPSTLKPVEEDQVATLNLATSTNQSPKREKNSDFDRLEEKILKRLQESGLRDYNIWLQLGEFYLKYDEPEKAKEIFALVLKQASGEAKEIARNRLLSL